MQLLHHRFRLHSCASINTHLQKPVDLRLVVKDENSDYVVKQKTGFNGYVKLVKSLF